MVRHVILATEIEAGASGGLGENIFFSDTGVTSVLLCFPLPDACSVQLIIGVQQPLGRHREKATCH